MSVAEAGETRWPATQGTVPSAADQTRSAAQTILSIPNNQFAPLPLPGVRCRGVYLAARRLIANGRFTQTERLSPPPVLLAARTDSRCRAARGQQIQQYP